MQCQTLEQYSVEYLEGTLTPDVMRAVEAHLEQCAHCRAQLAEARLVSASVRRLPLETCPDRMLAQVLQQHREMHVSWGERLAQWVGPVPVWKTGLATALMLIAAVAGWLYQGRQQPVAPPETYSAIEVAQAQQEVELALGYICRYMQHASVLVEYQLASAQHVVAEPVHEILTEQLQSTRTAVRQPVRTLMHEAAAPFKAAAAYLDRKESSRK